ncbi:MAG: 1-acyl-sn-glycerol-3-phosphate acyltransferase [Bacilli bacterium]|nr:1-acyl-sn-glycerol-3-phosphate acyltransferase [Bacilli bacterium]
MKKEPYYDPKPVRYPFPSYTDEHYLVVKKDDGTVFDSSYPYVDNSKKGKRKKGWGNFLLRFIVYPMTKIKLGLRIEGKENLRKYKEVLSKGAIMVSNHVHMWDYLAIRSALKRKMVGVLVWKKNISGEFGPMMRMVGGIPIPEGDFKATEVFTKDVNNFLQTGGLLQIYAEGSMWEYYKPIRPFKVGPAYFAVNNDKPILPMAFSYRPIGFIRKAFGQLATFTLHIGEPIFPNKELEGKDAQADMLLRVHDEVCRLAGIDPKENLYNPIFHSDHRVDYY